VSSLDKSNESFEAAIYPDPETMSRTALLMLDCSGQAEGLD
jgi:hypothetical protein